MRKFEKIFIRPVTKFCNSDGVNNTAAKRRHTKAGLTSFLVIDNLLHETKMAGANKIYKLHVKS